MSQVGETKIVVLFKDELRAAAVALHQLHHLNESQATREALSDACEVALQACFGALYHLGLPDFDPKSSHVTVSDVSVFKKKAV